MTPQQLADRLRQAASSPRQSDGVNACLATLADLVDAEIAKNHQDRVASQIIAALSEPTL